MKESRSKYIALKEPIIEYSKISDYLMLAKFKLTMMVVVSSLIAYAVASASAFRIEILFLLGIGGFLVTSASNSLNQVLERDFDKLMERTKNRPLAAKRMKVSEAVLFAGLALLFGILSLALINPLCALLGTISFVAYTFVYTPLKRYSTLSVALGAIPGAFPVLIGAVAASGSLTLLALILFGIQFIWQFPHFWSIGWLSFGDYKKAGFKLLPINDNGEIHESIGLHSFLYSLLLFPLLGLAVVNGLSLSAITICLIVIMNLIYSAYSFMFFKNQNRKSALALMMSSFFYLPIVLLSFLFS